MAGGWRLAKSLETLRHQVNSAYPNRSKASDGTIGDAAHARTASDHNPNANGVVCALDLTHDPARGFDAHALAEHLRLNRHPNLRYIISNARIAGVHTGWQWRQASGHYQHAHISVGNADVTDGRTTYNYDSTQPWNINYKGGEDMPIPDTDNYYWRYGQKLASQIRGRHLSREEFRRHLVGRSDLKAVEILSDDPEADKVQHWQDIGRVAVTDKWDKQIYALQDKVKELGSRPTAAQLEAVKKQSAELAKSLEKSKADAEKLQAEIEANKAKQQATVEEAQGFLATLFNQVRKLFSKGEK